MNTTADVSSSARKRTSSTRKRDASNFDDYLMLAMGLALLVALAAV